MPMRARFAGTKLPICAISAISAFWRRKVDLPAMFGPVTIQIWPEVSRATRRQIAGIGDERLAVARQRLLDHRMPAGSR